MRRVDDAPAANGQTIPSLSPLVPEGGAHQHVLQSYVAQ
jgi:hypothetical protein